MLEHLRAWLNGKKEYYSGVALYVQLGSNTVLANLFQKGATPFTTRRLEEELLVICKELKAKLPAPEVKENLHDKLKDLEQEKEDLEEKVDELEDTVYDLEDKVDELEKAKPKEPANPELYNVTKTSADKQFKQTMNDRAVLFSLANTEDFIDPNTPDRIEARAKLALAVVQGYQLTSQLYDKADYVKEHGRLPDQDENQEENEYDHLPDHQVKQTLDNLRKNFNKMKKREQTPERVAMQQKHEANIQKLLKRWHSLS